MCDLFIYLFIYYTVLVYSIAYLAYIIQYCFGGYRDTCTLIGRGCIISHSNPPMQGGYSWGAKFKNGCFAFCQYWAESGYAIEQTKIQKNTKDATQFDITLFKRIQ